MCEEVLSNLHLPAYKMMNFLSNKGIDAILDPVEFYTIGNEADVTEIDVWCKDGFIQIFYDINGNMTRYVTENNG